jgi:DNA primase
MKRMSAAEMAEELDLEFFLERESLAFKVTRGVSGVQLNLRCCPDPDCGDGRWRTYFGVDNGRGNCFVCGRSFNALSFIHLHLGHGDKEWGATFREVTELLAEQGYRQRREVVVAVDPGEVKLPTSIELPTPEGANLKYLEDRGFDGETSRYFHLRYCEFGWWRPKDAVGQAVRNDYGSPIEQNFSNRVIIPVYDLDGQLKTFQGRDLSGTSDRKYLFPLELPGTGRYLLNGQNVVATTEVAMGEGFGDVAAMRLAFAADPALRHIVCVGSFGKHLSYGSPVGEDQLGAFIKLKGRGVKRCTIMWDGGVKELEAALNAAKLITGLGIQVRIAMLPLGKDPNEVPPELVRDAYYKAVVWSSAADVKWRLRNPYK